MKKIQWKRRGEINNQKKIDKGIILDYESVMERLDGDKDFLNELLEIYMKEYVLHEDKFQEAIKTKNFVAIKELSHKMKGASINLSLIGLHKGFLQLELAALNKDIDKANEMKTFIEKEFEKLKIHLEKT